MYNTNKNRQQIYTFYLTFLTVFNQYSIPKSNALSIAVYSFEENQYQKLNPNIPGLKLVSALVFKKLKNYI